MSRATKYTFLLRFLPLLVWAIIILVLSVTPSPPAIDLGFFAWDKFQHAGAYALLTLFAGHAWRAFFRPGLAWTMAAVTAVIYGVLMEGAQSFTVVRVAEWGDVTADAVGALLVLLFVWAAIARRRKGIQ